MIDPATQAQLKEAITHCIGGDQGILETLRNEIRPLRTATHRIQPRSTTSISLVGTDGGNNQLQFDPFLIQLIRVDLALVSQTPRIQEMVASNVTGLIYPHVEWRR